MHSDRQKIVFPFIRAILWYVQNMVDYPSTGNPNVKISFAQISQLQKP